MPFTAFNSTNAVQLAFLPVDDRFWIQPPFRSSSAYTKYALIKISRQTIQSMTMTCATDTESDPQQGSVWMARDVGCVYILSVRCQFNSDSRLQSISLARQQLESMTDSSTKPFVEFKALLLALFTAPWSTRSSAHRFPFSSPYRPNIERAP